MSHDGYEEFVLMLFDPDDAEESFETLLSLDTDDLGTDAFWTNSRKFGWGETHSLRLEDFERIVGIKLRADIEDEFDRELPDEWEIRFVLPEQSEVMLDKLSAFASSTSDAVRAIGKATADDAGDCDELEAMFALDEPPEEAEHDTARVIQFFVALRCALEEAQATGAGLWVLRSETPGYG